MLKIEDIVAIRLKEARDNLGWSQERLASESGLSVGAIRGIEQRDRWPRRENVESIAAALGVSPSWLFSDPTEVPQKMIHPQNTTAEDLLILLCEQMGFERPKPALFRGDKPG